MQMRERKNLIALSIYLFLSWLSISCQKTQDNKHLKNIFSRHIRSLEFPPGSGMGIFFAAAIPLDIPDKSISVSWYFEANYGMPAFNESVPWGNIFEKRSISRRLLYDIIQSKLERNGYPGRACLLRTICESAKFPFYQNGLVGDIIRIIFTPSSSLQELLDPEIEEAEYVSNCSIFHKKCPLSFLDLISKNFE